MKGLEKQIREETKTGYMKIVAPSSSSKTTIPTNRESGFVRLMNFMQVSAQEVRTQGINGIICKTNLNIIL